MAALLATLLAASLAGALLWSFTEYGMHHWNGHLARGRTYFSREHLAHHSDATYFTPTRLKILLAAPGVLLVGFTATLLVGLPHGVAFAAGFVAAYVGYEWLHRRIHSHPPRNSYGRWARRHHLAHHFQSPKHNHGVTSPLWDLVFRTSRPVARVRVPPKQVMPWLLDPATGDVRAELTADFELAARRA